MRALASSDLHGNHAAYKWLARVAREKKVDLMILAGDLLGCPDGYESLEVAQRADARAIVDILVRSETPIYFIMGNDDFIDLSPQPDRFQSLHERRIEIGHLN